MTESEVSRPYVEGERVGTMLPDPLSLFFWMWRALGLEIGWFDEPTFLIH